MATTFEDVVSYFGGIPSLAQKLGIKPQAIYQWDGKIPVGRAYQIESLTNSDLTAASIIAGWPEVA